MNANTDIKARFKQHKCCVIIPTYNNAGTLTHVVQDVLQYSDDIIVVNDGSTDNTETLLRSFSNIHIVSYTLNRGKGYALRAAFAETRKKGYSYAITMDSDGQHFAKDLSVFLEKLAEEPRAIIIGSRFLHQENMPRKNTFANKFSNFWITVETGITLPDTLSGFRLYPLDDIASLRFFSSRYEFEVEVLARSAWNGVKLVSVPIDVYYAPKEERVSHFRPFKDFFRISVLNTVLVFLALAYYFPRNALRTFKKKSIKQVITEDIVNSAETNIKIAIAFGFGCFMGIFPIWGYQLVVGFALAHMLKLNKTIFFIAANISMPLFLPFILYLSYVVGGYVLGNGSWAIPFDGRFNFSFVKANLAQYLIGSIVFACVTAIITTFVLYGILKLFRKNR